MWLDTDFEKHVAFPDFFDVSIFPENVHILREMEHVMVAIEWADKLNLIALIWNRNKILILWRLWDIKELVRPQCPRRTIGQKLNNDDVINA